MSLQINIVKEGRHTALALDPDAVLSWEWLNPLLALDLSDDSYSLPLDVPITPHNQVLLGNPEILELKQNEDDVFWEVEVLEDGIPILSKAKMTLLEVNTTFDYKSGNYSVSVAGAASLFGSKVRYKSLNQLPLYPRITFTESSRDFAFNVMANVNTHGHRVALAFAPVHRPDYFDTGRDDYDEESMFANVSNRVHRMLSNGLWYFAPPSDALITDTPAAQGTVEYSQHRTIPFFKLSFIVKALFRYFGYAIDGDFFQIPSINDVYIDNNYGIEVYKNKNEDLNKSIDIKNHLPQMSVAEFLEAICKTFNLRLTFSKTAASARLDIKKIPDISNAINITPFVLNDFDSSPFEDLQGFTNFTFDSGDKMVANLIKENISLRASFETLAQANAYTFSPAIKDGEIIYIKSENLYYIYSIQHVKFLFYAEGQQGYVFKSESKHEIPLSPLLRWLEVNDTGANLDYGMCSATGSGSYVGFKAARVKSDFPLRLFMISLRTEAGMMHPVPYSTNINANLCLSYSVVKKGLYDLCYKRFNEALRNAKLIKTSVANEKLDLSLLENAPVQIMNNFYIVKQISNDIGRRGVADLELVKL